MRDERRAVKCHLFAVVQNPVDRVLFATWLQRPERSHILGYRHHLRAGQLFDERIAFLMIAMCVVAKQDS